MRLLAAAVAAFALFAGSAFAFDRGPPVGAAAPTVAGVTATGEPATFNQLTGAKGLIVAFSRSVDWCPYCQRQALQLQEALPEIQRRGYRLVMVTTDTPEKQAGFVKRRGVAYPMIADPQSTLIRQFNLVDPAYPEGHRVHGVPVPSLFFLDASGVVRAKLGDDDYKVRPTTEVVFATLDQID